MNTRTLAAVAGIDTGLLAVWISRGLVPGVTVGKKGGPNRHFDVEAAINVIIIAALRRLHISVSRAAKVCALREADDEKMLIGTRAVRGLKTNVSSVECVRLGLSLGPVVTVLDVRAIRDQILWIEREDGLSLDMVA